MREIGPGKSEGQGRGELFAPDPGGEPLAPRTAGCPISSGVQGYRPIKEDIALKNESDDDDDSEDVAAEGDGRGYNMAAALEAAKADWLNYVVGLAIVANAVLVGVETDFGSKKFVVFDHILCWVFVGELVLRVNELGCHDYFCDPSCVFDFSLVNVGVLDLYGVPIFLRLTGKGGSGGHLACLRLLRMLRVCRVLRLFHMFHELMVILQAFFNAFRSVCWIGLLVIILNYVLAVFLTQVVGHHSHMWDDPEDRANIELWFGTISRSFRMLFVIMTLSNWDIVAFVIIKKFPPVPVFIFFMMYIIVASYTMVSLITGVIAESLVSAQHTDETLRMREIEAEQKEFKVKLHTFLEGIDEDGDNVVTVKSIRQAVKARPDLINQLAALDICIDSSELDSVIESIQGDTTDGASIDAVVETMAHLNGIAKASTIFDIKHILLRMRRQHEAKIAETERDMEDMQRECQVQEEVLLEELQDLKEKVLNSGGNGKLPNSAAAVVDCLGLRRSPRPGPASVPPARSPRREDAGDVFDSRHNV